MSDAGKHRLLADRILLSPRGMCVTADFYLHCGTGSVARVVVDLVAYCGSLVA